MSSSHTLRVSLSDLSYKRTEPGSPGILSAYNIANYGSTSNRGGFGNSVPLYLKYIKTDISTLLLLTNCVLP